MDQTIECCCPVWNEKQLLLVIYRIAGTILAFKVKIKFDKYVSLPWGIREGLYILGSPNNAIATQETAKQIKSNAMYRYKRWGCKPKLKLESINVSYNTVTYVTRASEHSARIHPQPYRIPVVCRSQKPKHWFCVPSFGVLEQQKSTHFSILYDPTVISTMKFHCRNISNIWGKEIKV
jgi:hypothetical protein